LETYSVFDSMIVSDSMSARRRAARIVTAGGLVAFLTDTFYGLGANPFDVEALQAIKKLKGREAGKPILVVIADAAQTERFIAEPTDAFKRISEKHWPGPLTIVARARTEVPCELTAGTGTIGVRLPDDERVRGFVRSCGGALTATSANLAGEPPARTAQEVARSFPAGLSLIVDGGAALSERASTVLDVSGPEPRLIREGALSRAELTDFLISKEER
jgi:L-threonylcarbamoyladenylate synthase